MIWEMISNMFDINQMMYLAEGRYELENGIYVNIESYSTCSYEEKKYEIHRKYIDLQYIISGEECIYTSCSKVANDLSNYDIQKDIEFLDVEVEADAHVLKSGESLIIMPGIAHKPCIRSEEKSDLVKKAVFKIPLSVEKKLQYLVLDVDGTLTDGMIYMGNNGECCKAFNIKDGYGIANILPLHNIVPVIITGRNSKIVANRCAELHITDVYQGCSDKLAILKEILRKDNMALANVAYIGDDLNDLQCMQAVKDAGGIVACPVDAIDDVKKIADYISVLQGGHGAVREIIDWICPK